MYAVRFTPEARRNLARIPDKARPAVFEMIDGPIAENPRRVGKPLGLQLAGKWVARRGGFRIVYQIDDHASVVSIVSIAHRRDAYR